MANTTASATVPQSIATVSVDRNTQMSPETETLDESRRQLRCRWELASVLNFIRVFEPMIGKELKISATELEDALIRPNSSLAKLHITLLKGIPPVNKNLSNPDAWVTTLCKELAEWWPWIAEGEVPLIARKGDEISRYKELDPGSRLSMLKALCELRTEQDDLISYVNDELKQGTDISYFQVSKIAENKTGISFWYDGDSVMGYRLYKEVNKPQSKSKYKGKACIDQPPTNSEWETLATNLDEFQKVSEELSSSADEVEGTVCHTIETEVIPALEKVKKNQEKYLKRKQKMEALTNDYQPYVSRRTCRTRNPGKYTFDEFDRVIEEAINVFREGKDKRVARNGTKQDGNLSKDDNVEDDSTEEDAHKAEDGDGDGDSDSDSDSDTAEDADGNEDSKDDTDRDTSNSDHENEKHDSPNPDTLQSQSLGQKNHVSNISKRKESSESSDSSYDRHSRNPRPKNRPRQRPTHNSALVADSNNGTAPDNASSEVPDSDNGSSPDNASSEVPDSDNGCSPDNASSEVPDSEDDMSR